MEVAIFTAISGKLITICSLRWLHSRLVRVKNATLYFHFLPFFFLFFKKRFIFIIFISFDEVWNFCNRILTNQKPEYVIRNCHWNCTLELNEVCGNYVWILKWINLCCNWISLVSILSFPKQWVAEYRCVFRIQSNI